jgi:hypothetical protein
VGSPVLSDVEATSRVRRATWEPRPRNASANAKIPSSSELSRYFTYVADWGTCGNRYRNQVTGNHGLTNPTTDELIQWAAHKWGFDEDIIRGVAVKESYWNQDALGDFENGIPMSYGLTQVRRNNGGKVGPNWDGSFPLSRDSTAFNLDVWGASVRQYFEGCAAQIGGPNPRGDVWSSLGHWFWGWGSITDAGAQDYINAVRSNYTNQVWARSGF